MGVNEVIVLIESVKRTAGTAENFTVNVPKEYFLRPVMRVKLLDAMIPYTWYPFNTGNNKVTFSEPGGGVTAPVTFSIDTSTVYTASSLAAALQTLFNANSPNAFPYTVTFNTSSQKLVITSTGPNTLNLDFTASDSAYVILGFNKTTYAGFATYTANNMINFIGEKYIIINSDMFSGIDDGLIMFNGAVPPLPSPAFQAVPICANFGEIVKYNENPIEPWMLNVASRFAQTTGQNRTINFSLTFTSGLPVSLNGHNWSLRVIMSFEL